MIISSPLFEAYLECDTKCWLRAHAERGTGNTYAEWARLKNESYYEDGRKHLLATFPENSRAIAPPISMNAKDRDMARGNRRAVTNECLESRLQAVEKMPAEGKVKRAPLSLTVSNSPTSSPKTTSYRLPSTRWCSPRQWDAKWTSARSSTAIAARR